MMEGALEDERHPVTRCGNMKRNVARSKEACPAIQDRRNEDEKIPSGAGQL